ncbi:DUF4231 domain-containing protein [Geodermatophilus sp. FMUSA9-8]|uniref:DUF4231 domain-containing protein n=1 Tax=Geodermatophilus sp. FMUSA9-8 TaxID=3120155 RepID=UPI00300A818C
MTAGGASDQQRSVEALSDDDHPALFRAADRLALGAQRSAVRRNFGYLTLVIVAAIGGVVDISVRGDSLHLGGVISVIAFLGALLLGLATASKQPERQWYQGRAVAESVKSLAWCYAVGGEPFPVSRGDADALLVDRFRQILTEVSELNLSEVSDTRQISTKMRSLRTAALEQRRAAYMHGRVEDQCGWYSRKAKVNRRRGNQWAAAAAIASTLGIVAGLLRSVNALDVDLLGVLAAVAAGFSSWMQFRQHRTLSTSYALAAQDLGLVRDAAPTMPDEETWAGFVGDAEDAISREHTVWLARKSRA